MNLLNCIYCGGDKLTLDEVYGWRVQCLNENSCEAAGPLRDTEEEAAHAWNTVGRMPYEDMVMFGKIINSHRTELKQLRQAHRNSQERLAAQRETIDTQRAQIAMLREAIASIRD